jgi:two-component system sensor kinase FixL
MPTRLTVFGVRIPENAIQQRRLAPIAVALIVALATAEWYVHLDYSLGVLYTIPVLIASAAATRWQIVAVALLAALARAPFTPAASGVEAVLKFTMAAIAYTGTGLLVVEMSASRRRVVEIVARLQQEQARRHHAEEQLKALAESSPAAILTLDVDARVLAANLAAHQMLGIGSGTLVGTSVADLLPMFADALTVASHHRTIRTSVTGWAHRRDGHMFPIQAWFSVYGHGRDRCLAAIVVDMSEEVRDREREHFQHLLDHNRLLASAVSHEIRNLCAAMFVVCSNLERRVGLRDDADFDALVRLVAGLKELASFELRNRPDGEAHADLKALLDQLRVVIEPDWEEIEGEVVWDVPDPLPEVAAGGHGLMQIFLNLCQNSLRAVEGAAVRRLTITASIGDADVVLTFADTGPGVAHPDMLFQLHPERSRADGAGLGLYISRELARSVGGDLVHVPSPAGATFRVTVPLARRAALDGARRAS